MQTDRPTATGISIKPHYSYAYRYSLIQSPRIKLPPKRKHGLTELSRKAKSRMISAVQWMMFLSPMHSVFCKELLRPVRFRLNFITLTLSGVQVHTDKFILHRMLIPFLKWMRRKGATLYVWKAEVQDNGNIHFHITTNHYLHWRSIRNKWNGLQHGFGYLKKYFDEHGDHDPNSTDVHAVRNEKTIVGYMSKYLIKNDRYKKNQSLICTDTTHYYFEHLNKVDEKGKKLKRYVDVKVWSCSERLSKIRLSVTEECKEFKLIDEILQKESTAQKLDHGTLYLYRNRDTFKKIFQTFEESELNYS